MSCAPTASISPASRRRFCRWRSAISSINAMRRVVAIHRKGDWPDAQASGTVTLSYLDRHRRRIRLHGDDGTPFLLDLRRAVVLGEGDGLEIEGGGFLRVRAAAEALAEIDCRDGVELARIAW